MACQYGSHALFPVFVLCVKKREEKKKECVVCCCGRLLIMLSHTQSDRSPCFAFDCHQYKG